MTVRRLCCRVDMADAVIEAKRRCWAEADGDCDGNKREDNRFRVWAALEECWSWEVVVAGLVINK